jgi:hypothetical protein
MNSRSRRWISMALVASVLPFAAACSQHESHAAHAEHPAQVDKIDGSELSRVTLTEKAAERIDLKTIAVREQDVDGATRKLVPYSSLIYDAKGRTWVYTSPQPRTFVRQQVEVDRIDGDWVLLEDGPAAGTEVASVGVAEIYGAETGVGH